MMFNTILQAAHVEAVDDVQDQRARIGNHRCSGPTRCGSFMLDAHKRHSR